MKNRKEQMELDGVFRRISAVSNFPEAKINRLFEKLPPYSKELPAALCLLPVKDDIDEEKERYAAAITAMMMSAFIHDAFNKDRGFTKEEAVLYGDYLFSVAFSLLPLSLTREGGTEAIAAYKSFQENRLKHKKNPNCSVEQRISAIHRDYGKPLGDIARAAGQKMPEDICAAYAFAAEKIGTLWGILCEEIPISTIVFQEEAITTCDGLPMKEDLIALIKKLTGETC